MRMWAVPALVSIVLASIIGGGPAVAAGPEGGVPIVLRATGEDGAGLDGRCIVHGQTAEKTLVEIHAAVPFERRFAADAISCDLRASGRATVELSRGAGRSRSSTTGGRMIMRFGAVPRP